MKTDHLYQATVDREAVKLLSLPVDQLLALGDYGTIEVSIYGKLAAVGWWHHALSEHLHHFIFQLERPWLFIFHKKYLSGIKLHNGNLQKLTPEELGQYD